MFVQDENSVWTTCNGRTRADVDMSDKIIIKDLLVQGVIGVGEDERRKNQNILITLMILTDFSKVEKSDSIHDTINYSWVAKQLEKLVKEIQARTLEHLAGEIAAWVLALDSVVSVEVECSKPSAIALAKYATVKIVRKKVGHVSCNQAPGQVQNSGKRLCVPFSASRPVYSGISPTNTVGTTVAYIAIGSNLGERALNIETAIGLLKKFASVDKLSFLYETPAMYVTDQPAFINGACEIRTALGPEDLLFKLKEIESDMGRKPHIRYGPRIIDLDLLFYGSVLHNTSILTVPHPQLHERDFVLGPLMDICPDFEHPTLKLKVRQLFGSLSSVALRQVVPIRRKNKEGQISERVIYADQLSSTHVLGILNVTPDSFSDGGKLSTVELAVAHATTLVENAGEQNVSLLLDVGGESTRPGAEPVSEEEELNRVLPVIESLQVQQPNVTISIDTTKPNVARAAIRSGASIINDVSAGNSDIDISPMASVAVEERVPFIIMHSRGTPQTMKQLAVYPDDVPVIRVVAQELNKNIETALALGVYPWQIVTDPGIGFAKQLKHNLDILKDLPQWSALVGHFPLLVGTSRKAFIGAVTHQPEAEKRVFGTAATVASAIASGANFVRVHDVTEICDVVLVSDAIYRPESRH